MGSTGWVISFIAFVVVVAAVVWAARARHPEQTAGHQHHDGDPPRLAGGAERPAGPDAESMDADLRIDRRQDAPPARRDGGNEQGTTAAPAPRVEG
jgi:hypothetical protein